MAPKRADAAELDLNLNLFSSSQQIRGAALPDGTLRSCSLVAKVIVRGCLRAVYACKIPAALSEREQATDLQMERSVTAQRPSASASCSAVGLQAAAPVPSVRLRA